MFLNLVKIQGFQICVYFFSSFNGCWVISKYCNFSLNKSCQIYLGPMLHPVGRNWQLIAPHFKDSKSVFCFSRIENLLAGEASRKNDLSLAPIFKKILNFKKFLYACKRMFSLGWIVFQIFHHAAQKVHLQIYKN